MSDEPRSKAKLREDLQTLLAEWIRKHPIPQLTDARRQTFLDSVQAHLANLCDTTKAPRQAVTLDELTTGPDGLLTCRLIFDPLLCSPELIERLAAMQGHHEKAVEAPDDDE
jgi:hypothetical protein